MQRLWPFMNDILTRQNPIQSNGHSKPGIVEEKEEKEMSFLEHLEELRWHLIRSALAIVFFAVAAFINKDFIFGELILGPSRPNFLTYRGLCAFGKWIGQFGLWQPDFCIQKLDFIIQNRTMTGQFTTHISVSLITGLIAAFPYVFWEIWRFIAPGLYDKERNSTRGAVLFVTFLFITGVLFGYYFLSPLTINFLAGYQIDPTIENFIDLGSYISTLTTMVLACGLIFQLPAAALVATKVGIISAALMRRFRKHAFVIILVASALLTPSPDAFSMFALAMPLYCLYEMSIWLAVWVERGKRKLAMAAEALGVESEIGREKE